MKEIKLTQGKVALVDDEDFEMLNQWKWQTYKAPNAFYVKRFVRFGDRQTHISMHRIILNTPPGMETDHIDGNGLNNQKNNLRTCNKKENQHNQKIRANCGSRFKGVHWNKRDKLWQSRICLDGKRKFLGGFVSEMEAAIAYDVAAKTLFGEFANTNLDGG